MKQTKELAGNGKPYTVFLVNGQPVKFKGVNIHEHNPETGHYVPVELMRKDFELMKSITSILSVCAITRKTGNSMNCVMNTGSMFMMKPTSNHTVCIIV